MKTNVNVITGFALTTLGQVVDEGAIVTACYVVDTHEYCFYADGTELHWDAAKKFCARKNSTLPIVKDEDAENVFQQFLVNASYVTDVIHSYYIHLYSP